MPLHFSKSTTDLEQEETMTKEPAPSAPSSAWKPLCFDLFGRSKRSGEEERRRCESRGGRQPRPNAFDLASRGSNDGSGRSGRPSSPGASSLSSRQERSCSEDAEDAEDEKTMSVDRIFLERMRRETERLSSRERDALLRQFQLKVKQDQDAEDANIEEIIRLKMQVANQEATIDTLSTEVHNLELANRQLRNGDRCRMTKLEEENKILSEQLKISWEREVRLRKELNLERTKKMIPSERPQRSNERSASPKRPRRNSHQEIAKERRLVGKSLVEKSRLLMENSGCLREKTRRVAPIRRRTIGDPSEDLDKDPRSSRSRDENAGLVLERDEEKDERKRSRSLPRDELPRNPGMTDRERRERQEEITRLLGMTEEERRERKERIGELMRSRRRSRSRSRRGLSSRSESPSSSGTSMRSSMLTQRRFLKLGEGEEEEEEERRRRPSSSGCVGTASGEGTREGSRDRRREEAESLPGTEQLQRSQSSSTEWGPEEEEPSGPLTRRATMSGIASFGWY